MSTLYKIVDKNKKRITFKRNRAQADFNKNKTNRNIILKSRRIGFTTDECIDMLDDVLFTQNFSGLFIAHTEKDATEIFDKKIDFVWKNIDDDVKRLWTIDSNTAKKLKFGFGDNTFSSIIVSNSGRSGISNRVHVSELAKLCARYPAKADEIISGTFPSVPPEGRIDIESTAEGMSGNYYEIFDEAWKRRRPARHGEFTAFFYNWTWDDEEIAKIRIAIPVSDMEESRKFVKYQELHKLSDIQITFYYSKWCLLKKDWNTLHQEYPTTPEEAFIASGNCFFNKERIVNLATVAKQPIEVPREKIPEKLLQYYLDKELLIWELPKPYGSYVSGGDVAEGKGQDRSTLKTINNKTANTVCAFKSDRIRPDDYAMVCNEIGRWYNWSYMGIESNSGLWVLTELLEKYQYPNLYFRERIDDITHAVSKQVGFHTGGTSRKVMLDHLQVQVNLLDGFYDKDFLGECLTFVRNDVGRPEADEGSYDDEVIATGICHFIRENAPAEKERPISNLASIEDRVRLRLEAKKKANIKGISQKDYI